MIKTLYVLLDEEGDVVEYFSENSSIDHIFELKRISYPKGTINKATLIIEDTVREKIYDDEAKIISSKVIKIK